MARLDWEKNNRQVRLRKRGRGRAGEEVISAEEAVWRAPRVPRPPRRPTSRSGKEKSLIRWRGWEDVTEEPYWAAGAPFLVQLSRHPRASTSSQQSRKFVARVPSPHQGAAACWAAPHEECRAIPPRRRRSTQGRGRTRGLWGRRRRARGRRVRRQHVGGAPLALAHQLERADHGAHLAVEEGSRPRLDADLRAAARHAQRIERLHGRARLAVGPSGRS